MQPVSQRFVAEGRDLEVLSRASSRCHVRRERPLFSDANLSCVYSGEDGWSQVPEGLPRVKSLRQQLSLSVLTIANASFPGFL